MICIHFQALKPPSRSSVIRSIALLCLLAAASFHADAADGLAAQFAQPPAATRPRCYWYWMDGHISKEGITKDLEAMKRVGIGGAFIGVISGQSGAAANPDPKALTPQWWGFIEHAIREGSRIGVQIGLFNSPGWSQTSGPWVSPEQAMRYVVQTETPVKGPQRFATKLPAPQEGFQPLTVQAFPAPAGNASVAKINSRSADAIVFQMPENSSARSLTVRPTEKINVAAELQTSADGTNFRTVIKFQISRHNMMLGVGPLPLAPVVISFPAVADRHFRLLCSSANALGEVQLSAAARVESFAEKSLLKMFQEPLPPFDFYSWPPAPEPESTDLCIRPETIIDLTGNLRPDGTLEWNVPPGDWIILRSGLAPTGTKNSPAPTEATGLEVDKMNRAALKAHFDAYITPLLKKLSPAERKSWTHVIADSYEAGPQNWTDGFAADFQKSFGYDPLRFLPVMGGRVVGSADQSDRFLWDLRRFVADRIATEYVGGLRELCHQAGLKLWLDFPVENDALGGDPAYLKEKQLTVEFTSAGKPGTITLTEHSRLQLPTSPELPGPWNVTFQGRSLTFEKLISWTEHPDAGIKYFSGSASYSTRFQISKLQSPIHLDLGTVHAIAKVRLNGKEIATLWKEPYTTDITAALKQGSNTLEVVVINSWHNRLVGDRQAGATPTTFTTTNQFNAETPLQPSGLLGPVRLVRRD